MLSRPMGQPKSRRIAAAFWLALALALALALGAQPVKAASAGRLSIAIVPDLAYPGLDRCQACDGRFSAADARLGNAMPIGPLRVRISTESGALIAEQMTVAQPNGRQSAVFSLATDRALRVAIADLPGDWRPCGPSGSILVTAGELHQREGRISIGLWRGCEPGTDSGQDVQKQGTHAVAADQPRSAAAFHRQLSGQVFVDRDLDGRADVGEVGLAGVRVTLVEGRRTHKTRSNPSGNFTFRGLQSGDLVVEVELPAGYRVTTADRFTQVSGGPGPWTADPIAFGLIESGDGPSRFALGGRPPMGNRAATLRRAEDRLRSVAAWPQWAGAAASTHSVGMIGLVPEDGAGRHPNPFWKG